MPTIKIVPFPGAPGPQGPRGLQGIQGEVGLTGPIGPAGESASFPEPVAWTPVLSGAGFSQTSNPATGDYMKYGRMVVANLTVPFANATDLGSGQYSITLPFPASKHTDVWAGTLHNTSSNDFYSIKGHVDAGESVMTLWYISGDSKDQPFDFNSPIILNTEDLFHMNFIYETTT